MKNFPTWIKVLSAVLVAVIVLAVAASLYKAVKGDGGPDNSIFDKWFGADPPTTDDKGPDGNSGSLLGERADGEYIEYLVHSGNYTSEGLIMSYLTGSKENNTSLVGFGFNGLEPGKNYCVSWSIDKAKFRDEYNLFLPETSYGKSCIKFSLNYTGDTTVMQAATTAEGVNIGKVYTNMIYFTAPEDVGDCFFGFVETEYIGDDTATAKKIADKLKDCISFTVSVNE